MQLSAGRGKKIQRQGRDCVLGFRSWVLGGGVNELRFLHVLLGEREKKRDGRRIFPKHPIRKPRVFLGPVEIGGFKQSYFPPGCLAENVRVLHNSNPGGTPLVTIQKLMVQGSFSGMFSSPKRLAEVAKRA